MVAGDTLYVRAGTYLEQINSNAQTIPTGTSWVDAPRISAYPNETVTIRGGGSEVINLAASYIRYLIFDGFIIDAINSGDGISFFGGSNHVRIQNCEIKNCKYQGILTSPGNGLSSDYNEFINLRIHDTGTSGSGHAIYISTSNNLVDRCELYTNQKYGVQVYNGNYPSESANYNTIRNSKFHDCGLLLSASAAAIVLSSGTGNVAYNNLVYNNRAGIQVATSALTTATKVFNNTIYSNTYQGVLVQSGGSNTLIKNNIIYLNGALPIEDHGTNTLQLNNLTTNPSFVSV